MLSSAYSKLQFIKLYSSWNIHPKAHNYGTINADGWGLKLEHIKQMQCVKAAQSAYTINQWWKNGRSTQFYLRKKKKYIEKYKFSEC